MTAPFDVLRRRLVAAFDMAAWPVLLVNAIPAQAHESADVVTRTPPHWLAAAWRPLQEGPDRWPEAVVIGSPAADNALAELCARLPSDARLFLAGVDALDAALAADILLAADRNLEAYQRTALARFAAAERARVAARVARDYTDHDEGFARFRAGLDTPS